MNEILHNGEPVIQTVFMENSLIDIPTTLNNVVSFIIIEVKN